MAVEHQLLVIWKLFQVVHVLILEPGMQFSRGYKNDPVVQCNLSEQNFKGDEGIPECRH
jgi:hypothetical protein